MSAKGRTKVTAVDGGLSVLPPSTGGISVKVGPCSLGANNVLLACGTPEAVRSQAGYGPTADAAVVALNTEINGISPSLVYIMPSEKTTPGAAGAVTTTRIGASTGTLVTTGSVPVDKYSFLVKIRATGGLGAGRFTWSPNGGLNESAWIVIPSGGTYVVPSIGVTLVFANGAGPTFFEAGDKFEFATTAPISSTVAVTAAFQALLKDARTWGFAHLVGQPASPSALATMFDTISTQMNSFEAADRTVRTIIEAPVDTDGNLITAMAVKADERIATAADELDYTIPDTGFVFARSVGWAVAARAACVPPREDLSRVASGNVEGVSLGTHRDERQTPGLDTERFCIAYTYADPDTPGIFITGQLFSAPGSDFDLWQFGRIMDEVCAVLRAALRKYESDDAPVVPGENKLDPGFVEHLTGDVLFKIGARMAGQITEARFAIGDVSNIFLDKKLPCTVGIVPRAYFKDIEAKVAFVNPFAR